MTHLTPSKKPSVLSKRITVAGFSAVAAAAFIFSAGSAQAGPKELAAIEAKLPDGVDIYANPKKGTTAATFAQLEDALVAVLGDAAYDNLPLGVLVGELLKAPGSVVEENAGQVIAQAIDGQAGLQDLAKVLGDAAKTAATSKGANPIHVSSFAEWILDSGDAAAVKTAAEFARSSKTAVAEILAGFASVGGVDPTQVATDALNNPKLAGAVTEIAREVGAVANDPAAFATALSLVKSTLTLKVAPGVVASNPEEAGEITEALLANETLNPVVVKGMASFAKAVSAVADIEQISVVGAHLAREIGANAAGAKTSVAAGLAKTLALAIFSKPEPTAADGYTLTSPQGALTVANRADEIAEVAAYVAGGILGNTALAAKNYKALNSTVLGIIKGAIAGSANKKLKTVTAAFTTPIKEDLIVDIAGSVALTIDTFLDSLADQTLAGSLRTSLDAFLAKSAKSIAGKSTTLQAEVKDVIQIALGIKEDTEGLVAKLENGLDPAGPIVDPETDTKNF